jgi:hypothetical protein
MSILIQIMILVLRANITVVDKTLVVGGGHFYAL